MSRNPIQTQISYWVPGGSVVYSGAPMTRWAWITLTWRGYVAWWCLTFRCLYLIAKEYVRWSR